MKRIGKRAHMAMALVAAALLLLTAGCTGTQAAVETGGDAVPEAAVAADTAIPESTELQEAKPAAVTLDVGLLGTSVKPVGVLVAEANGYFAEEGVAVNFEKVSSMNDAYAAVAAGDLDVYLFSSTAAATFISQGTTTLRVFGGTAGEGSEIMAAKGSGIRLETPADFAGLTIACSMPETGQMVLKDYLLQQGLTIGGPEDGADVAFVYIGDSSVAIEGCVKGEYDLCITNASLGYYADDYGVEVVGTVKDFVETYPCCRQTCNQQTYENEFDALVKFETATLRGYEFYRDNMDATLDILEEYSGEDRDFLQAQLYGTDAYAPVMRISIDPDKTACIRFYEALVNVGEIEDRVDVDWNDYVVTDVYQTALATLAAREPDNALWGELTGYFDSHNA